MIILVVEDNRALAANIIEYLEAYGYECDYAETGPLAINLLNSETYNAIILDIMLPGIDGMTICDQLRQMVDNPNQEAPVLMLTARDALGDKLKGFDVGADDYLIKPFDLAELIARVRALVRRTVKRSISLRVADLEIHPSKHEVIRAGKKIELNKACWKILNALIQASPKVVTRQEIEQIIWPDQKPDSDVLKSHIYQLRQRIDKPFDSPLIHTVRGVGLQLKPTQVTDFD